jgi:hypothetical protein
MVPEESLLPVGFVLFFRGADVSAAGATPLRAVRHFVSSVLAPATGPGVTCAKWSVPAVVSFDGLAVRGARGPPGLGAVARREEGVAWEELRGLGREVPEVLSADAGAGSLLAW